MKTSSWKGGALEGEHRVIKISKEINSFHIFYISDMHFVNNDEALFTDLAHQVNKITEKIDLVIWGGDLLSEDNGFIYLKKLKDLFPNIPTLAILGNHDVSHDKFHYKMMKKLNWKIFLPFLYSKRVRQPDILREKLKDIGVVLLEDALTQLTINNSTINFYGVKQPHMCLPHTKPKGFNLPKDELNILLVHRPDMLPHMISDFDLLLGGHTHGGQVHLPLLGALTSNCGLSPKTTAGLYSVGKTQWYVNNGFSATSNLRFRLKCPRQFSVLKIKKGEPDSLKELEFNF